MTRPVSAVSEYLLSATEERPTMSDLPARFHASATQTLQSFQGVYGMSPAAFLRAQKMHGAAGLLRREGYPCESCGKCLAVLARKLCSGGDFPHEIGLFLSYPPEDVKGFIENRAANYKCCGMWKVYSDERKAKELFAKYKKCTDIYCERYRAGCRIDELAVAV